MVRFGIGSLLVIVALFGAVKVYKKIAMHLHAAERSRILAQFDQEPTVDDDGHAIFMVVGDPKVMDELRAERQEHIEIWLRKNFLTRVESDRYKASDGQSDKGVIICVHFESVYEGLIQWLEENPNYHAQVAK